VPSQIDHRYVVRLLAIGRVAIGVMLLVLPRRIGRGWIGESASAGGGKIALRAVGARDIAIGYGTIRAFDEGDPSLRQWVTIAGSCDLADTVATVLAFRKLPKRGRMLSLAIAAGAATAAFAARNHLD
jgi:hypothetical protein